MAYRELDSKPRKRFMLRLSEEERKLLDLKAKQYGYKHLSDYIRDSCIYESLVQINVSYTAEVSRLFQEYIDEIKKYTKEVRRVLKYDTSASPEERDMIQQSLYRVYSQTRSLKNSVNDNLNIEEIVRESRMRLYRKQCDELEKEFEVLINEK